jgi:hypothetical protein
MLPVTETNPRHLQQLTSPGNVRDGAAVPIVYVAGADRSGSTLLGMLLGNLAGTISVGEMRHLWSRGVLNDELC